MRFFRDLKAALATRHVGQVLVALALINAAILSVGAQSTAPHAQGAQSAAKKTSSAAWQTQKCGDGVTLRLSSLEPRQGSLQLAELWSASPLKQASATWNGNAIPFWKMPAPAQGPAAAKTATEKWRGLVGVDLELAAGAHDLAISGQTAAGENIACTASLDLKPGSFRVERLSVAPQFVQPNPEQLAQAQEDTKRIQAIYANPTAEKLWNGAFRLPLAGAPRGGNFGTRRVLNGQASSPHTGVDFPSPAGTPVYATQRGKVALADPLYFSGNTVIIDHGLGVFTFYGHLTSFSVKAGDIVQAGDEIGKVGATGRVTGPHLHWGLNVNHARVNATQLLKFK